MTRQFNTGATRDSENGKYDYEGFLSPLVIKTYARYMNKHRVQSDGQIRDADNWQKGMPLDAYMKSGYRHFMDWWLCHRDFTGEASESLEDALCALIFNASGYLHELLKADGFKRPQLEADTAEAQLTAISKEIKSNREIEKTEGFFRGNLT